MDRFCFACFKWFVEPVGVDAAIDDGENKDIITFSKYDD